MEELIEEILLRLPPGDPGSLLRATLVCKPPLLGALYHHRSPWPYSVHFAPISSASFRPPYAHLLPNARCVAVDARHGRVLFHDFNTAGLIVLNPITGEERRLPMPRRQPSYGDYNAYWNAAVLCAAPGCDHLDCPRGGAFTVVFVATERTDDGDRRSTYACVYSSEAAGAWREANHTLEVDDGVTRSRSVFVGNALYFMMFKRSNGIIEFDLSKHELSLISLPDVWNRYTPLPLMTAEDGALGFAFLEDFKLYMWSRSRSRQAAQNGWVQNRVIELRRLLPFCALSTSPVLLAFVGSSMVYTISWGRSGVFVIDLKSGHAVKLCETDCRLGIVPYTSFYTPSNGSSLYR